MPLSPLADAKGTGSIPSLMEALESCVLCIVSAPSWSKFPDPSIVFSLVILPWVLACEIREIITVSYHVHSRPSAVALRLQHSASECKVSNSLQVITPAFQLEENAQMLVLSMRCLLRGAPNGQNQFIRGVQINLRTESNTNMNRYALFNSNAKPSRMLFIIQNF